LSDSELVHPVITARPVNYASLKIFTGTWNVGDRPPPYQTLKDWFFGGSISASSGDLPYDIVAVGAQECSYKPRVGYESCEKDWAAAVSEAVGADFELVSATSLRDSIRLLLFVRKRLLNHVHSIRSSTYSTTIPMFWRKGGIGVQISYLSTNLVFITAHLAAHASETNNRNSDIASILKTLGLGNPNYDTGHQFHHCFFMGDLNYRLNSDNLAETISLIAQQQWSQLLSMDQLIKEKNQGNIFYDFHEPDIQFAPTFKVARGTRSDFDRKRIPSWCDRILVHSLPECIARATAYNSIDTILTSDHVPVYANWDISVPIIKLLYRNETALRTFLCATSRSPSPFATNFPTIAKPLPLSSSSSSSSRRHASYGGNNKLADGSSTFDHMVLSASTSDLATAKSLSSAPSIVFPPSPPPSAPPPPSSLSSYSPYSSSPTTMPHSFPLPPQEEEAEWNICSEVLNSDARSFSVELSEVCFILLDPSNASTSLISSSSSSTTTTTTTCDIKPRIVLSSPILSIEPIKSEPILFPTKEWRWSTIPHVSTKFTTATALSHHHLFIAVYQYLTPTTERLIGHAVVSLKNHLSLPALFELPLIYCGRKRGIVSGTLGLRIIEKEQE
jgi:endonuclease/exonuclease/phosphatase family metal-dependent hydrolase